MQLPELGSTATASAPEQPSAAPPEPTEVPEEEPEKAEAGRQEEAEEEKEAQPEEQEKDADKIAKLEAKVEKLTQNLKTAQGRLQKAQADGSQTAELARAVSRLRGQVADISDHLASEEPDASQFREKRQAHQQQEQLGRAELKVKRKAGKLNEWVSQKAGRYDVKLDDSRFSDAIDLYQRAERLYQEGNLDDADDLLDEARTSFEDVFGVIQEEHLTETRTESRRRDADRRRKSGDLNVDGGSPAAAGGLTSQELVNRFSRGEKLSKADEIKAGKLLDQGVYPDK